MRGKRGEKKGNKNKNSRDEFNGVFFARDNNLFLSGMAFCLEVVWMALFFAGEGDRVEEVRQREGKFAAHIILLIRNKSHFEQKHKSSHLGKILPWVCSREEF